MKFKKFFVVLLIFLIAIFIVACSENNRKESFRTTDKNTAESEVNDEDVKVYKQEEREQDSNKDEYYIIIKEAWQKQKDYVDSIEDSIVKQSTQTPESAAIMESNRLLIEHPEDSEFIDISLKRVLEGE